MVQVTRGQVHCQQLLHKMQVASSCRAKATGVDTERVDIRVMQDMTMMGVMMTNRVSNRRLCTTLAATVTDVQHYHLAATITGIQSLQVCLRCRVGGLCWLASSNLYACKAMHGADTLAAQNQHLLQCSWDEQERDSLACCAAQSSAILAP